MYIVLKFNFKIILKSDINAIDDVHVVLENYLFTHDQQFGFKSKHSSDFCIFPVKSVSKYYTQQHSPLFTFFEACKAFDKIIILNYFESYLIVKRQ